MRQPRTKNQDAAASCPRRRYGPAGSGRRGFTLVEMLVVIAIIGILMTLTAAAYLSLRNTMRRRGDVMELAYTLRRARAFALSSGTHAEVRIEPLSNGRHLVQAIGFEVLGLWHLENGGSTGAEGRPARVVGGDSFAQGRLGRAVMLPDGGYIDLGSSYDFVEGGMVEACFFPRRYHGKQALFKRPGELDVWMDAEGVIHAQVGRQLRVECSTLVEPEPPPSPSQKILSRTERIKRRLRKQAEGSKLRRSTYRLPLYDWSKVAVRWLAHEREGKRRLEVAILVDDVVRAEAKDIGDLRRSDATQEKTNLTVGAPNAHFFGGVDEIRVLGAVWDDQPWELPARAKPSSFKTGRERIHFNSRGQLDRRYHGGPEKISFIVDGDRQATLTLTPQGLLESVAPEDVWSKAPPPPPPVENEQRQQ